MNAEFATSGYRSEIGTNPVSTKLCTGHIFKLANCCPTYPFSLGLKNGIGIQYRTINCILVKSLHFHMYILVQTVHKKFDHVCSLLFSANTLI